MEERKRSGYGSTRWWKWLLLYLAVGAVIYLIAYFVFFANSGGPGGGGY
jgi:hypothetical protein